MRSVIFYFLTVDTMTANAAYIIVIILVISTFIIWQCLDSLINSPESPQHFSFNQSPPSHRRTTTQTHPKMPLKHLDHTSTSQEHSPKTTSLLTKSNQKPAPSTDGLNQKELKDTPSSHLLTPMEFSRNMTHSWTSTTLTKDSNSKI